MERLYGAAERMAEENLTAEEVARRLVAEYRERHELVPGFGHPMHRGGVEPRGPVPRVCRRGRLRDGTPGASRIANHPGPGSASDPLRQGDRQGLRLREKASL